MLAPERANGFAIAPVNSTDVTKGIVAHGDALSSFTVRVRSADFELSERHILPPPRTAHCEFALRAPTTR